MPGMTPTAATILQSTVSAGVAGTDATVAITGRVLAQAVHSHASRVAKAGHVAMVNASAMCAHVSKFVTPHQLKVIP
jgi:hypothetical protein